VNVHIYNNTKISVTLESQLERGKFVQVIMITKCVPPTHFNRYLGGFL